MTQVHFTIEGPPQGKARPRVTRHGTYTPSKTKEYERAIQDAYRDQVGDTFFEGPVSVDIFCLFPIPKSRTKGQKKEMVDWRVRPCVKPDLDNVVKAVCDALNGIAWQDDNQVCDLCVRKQYGETPGVFVSIKGKANNLDFIDC